MLLSQQERDKFCAWLKLEIESDKGITEQMKRINSPEVVIKKLETEMMAAMVILDKLMSIKDMTIS